jgi:hypothetical protein
MRLPHRQGHDLDGYSELQERGSWGREYVKGAGLYSEEMGVESIMVG